jgi:opacity protein-like surface antigen
MPGGANLFYTALEGGMRMRRCLGVCLSALIIMTLTVGASAADFNLMILTGASVPVGDFGQKSDIVEPTQLGAYEALGGGAETGFGFNLELEIQASRRLFVGGGFGYARYDADATDVMEKLIKPAVPEVSAVDAFWTLTALGGFARLMAFDLPHLDLYGRLGLAVTKMKNTFDVNYDSGMGTFSATSDFNLGNQFSITVGIGAEYTITERLLLVTELRLNHLFSDGAEATASSGEYNLAGVQKFNAQSFDITVGLRIPLSGI